MIEKQLFKTIKEFFPDANANANANDWQTVLDQCNVGISVFHLFNTAQYYVAYYSKNSSINLSIILYRKNQAIGVMPLIVHQDEGQGWVLSSNGVDIIEPIYLASLEPYLLEKSKQYNKKLSRLCCQIEIKNEYDGLIVHLLVS